jgi:hypothetical protein
VPGLGGEVRSDRNPQFSSHPKSPPPRLRPRLP